MKLLNNPLLSIFAASGLASAASSSALFYNFPGANTRQETVKLSQVDTRLALASKLGVSRYHSLGSSDGNLLQLEQKGSLWLDRYDREGSVLITVGGVVDPKSILPNRTPALELKDQPASSSFGELLTNLKTQKEQMTGHEALSVYSNPIGSFVYVISPTGRSDVRLQSSGDWEKFESLVGAPNAASFSEDVTSDMNFVQEYVALNSLLGAEMEKAVAARTTVIAQFVSLEALQADHGSSSKEYKTAVALTSKLFGMFAAKAPAYQTTIGFLGLSTKAAKKDFVGEPVKFVKREEIPITSQKDKDSKKDKDDKSKPKPTDQPLKKYSPCFKTLPACNEITGNCSGRGECVHSKIKIEICFSCKCKPTKDDKGRKTYWGGSACQKRDISVPFAMLFFFTVAMILLLYYAIGQMMAMGNEELPGVLSAGVSGVKKT